jgi:DNA-binding NarL/FixJ family response regulator
MTQKTIKLFLVDDDPIFRLGFSTAISAFNDFQIIAQIDNAEAALEELTRQVPNLLILDLNLGNSTGEIQSWQFCQQVKENYSNLPIFIISSNLDTETLLAAQALGIQGYCPKGTNIETIAAALRQVASGDNYWQISNLATRDRETFSLQARRKNRWLSRLHQMGIQQIEENLTQIDRQLNRSNLSNFDWFYWRGRKRELLASRWLVDRLLPVDVVVLQERSNPPRIPPPIGRNLLARSLENSGAIESQQSISEQIFTRTLTKIRSGVENLTKTPLEIDILKTEKKQELLYLVIDRLRKSLEELKFLQIKNEELIDKVEVISEELWRICCTDFFRRYYQQEIQLERDLSQLIANDWLDRKENFLNVFFQVDLFAYLLGQKPLKLDNVEYRLEAPESIDRAEKLLHNFIIQIANRVMQFNLNNFADLETSKYNLYRSSQRSSREIANFRNQLAWKYRQNLWWQEPKDIFESRYRLLYFNGIGIKQYSLYAPRTRELEQLRGIPWLVTIALETRDALTPRIQAIISFVSSGVIYFLTQVIGRGIGLIGKGIIQGIGNSVQEARYGKERDRNRG